MNTNVATRRVSHHLQCLRCGGASSGGGGRGRRVGVVGFGKVGQFLVQQILHDPRSRGVLQLAFVCDVVAPDAVANSALVPDECKARTLDDFERFGADIIVEVAHPDIAKQSVRVGK